MSRKLKCHGTSRPAAGWGSFVFGVQGISVARSAGRIRSRGRPVDLSGIRGRFNKFDWSRCGPQASEPSRPVFVHWSLSVRLVNSYVVLPRVTSHCTETTCSRRTAKVSYQGKASNNRVARACNTSAHTHFQHGVLESLVFEPVRPIVTLGVLRGR